MAEPKKRMTSTRSGNRRSHHAIVAQSLHPCSNCKKLILPHRACPHCGFYHGRRVIKVD